MDRNARTVILFLVVLCLPFAASAEAESGIAARETALVIQIGVILFAVRVGAALAQRIGVPTVLGELLAGIVIGPYALGALPLPGFPAGLFAGSMGELAVSSELYGIATVASILLLFVSGLETDLSLLLRYSVAGGIIGIGGVVLSFATGDLLGMVLFRTGAMDPRALFLGIMSTATSVGITARILSDRRKMDSPEGVTILAAAVFDDVLGIVFLAAVMGIAALTREGTGESLPWGSILGIAGRAFGFWLGFTALGLLLSKQLARFLKSFRNPAYFSILALGLALILAGIFEKQGLAMIIGAYVLGISLSKSDISHVILDKIHGLYEFLVPLFFAVMGMLVNVRLLLDPAVLIGGLAYALVSVASKFAGCGLPALFLGFNGKGALRIGAGMVPRGEVALIVAGIGLSGGLLSENEFGMAILMTLITTVAAPPVLSAALRLPGRGTRAVEKGAEAEAFVYAFPSEDVAVLVSDVLIRDLQEEGFFVQLMNVGDGIAQVRKDDIAFSLERKGVELTLRMDPSDAIFVKTALFEAVAQLNQRFEELRRTMDPKRLTEGLDEEGGRVDPGFREALSPDCIVLNLKGTDKESIITELVDTLDSRGCLSDRDQVLRDVLDREKSMSTGMQHGIALPHAKTEGVGRIVAALGLLPGGVDFKSLDGEPAKVILLLASPSKQAGPHIQVLASAAALLNDDIRRADLLAAQSVEEAALILGLSRRRTPGRD